MYQAHIVGIGFSVPQRVLANKDLELIVDTSDTWITRRTGIQERRISSLANNESTADLGTQASLEALKMADMSPDSLDMIVVGTATPDRQFPAAACMIQSQLGANDAFAFDVTAGCSGFLYGLSIVDNAIRVGSCQNALVIGTERLSSMTNWSDRGTCVLLGDGAGAVVVRKAEDGQGILSTHMRSDGRLWDLLYASYGGSDVPDLLDDLDTKPFILKMEGNRLFKRAVEYMSEAARKALDYNGLTHDDISLLISHQANLRIIQAIAKNLDISMDKVYTNVHKYGNTSSASIPIALAEAFEEGRVKKGDYVLLVAFGAGLTWGSALIRWVI